MLFFKKRKVGYKYLREKITNFTINKQLWTNFCFQTLHFLFFYTVFKEIKAKLNCSYLSLIVVYLVTYFVIFSTFYLTPLDIYLFIQSIVNHIIDYFTIISKNSSLRFCFTFFFITTLKNIKN